ncbi:MAG: hypothetical protein M5U26_11115 [Planctomycetota bacterium]|nr:hypothetical protein [Planctomycetota bacterium]
MPVFRYEDTEGDPLQTNLEPIEPPPLMEVAKAWGLRVRYMGRTSPYLGLYRHRFEDHPAEILLATHEEQVFFHELAHAAQWRVWTDPDNCNKLRLEVTAELASCVLARLYGRQDPNEGSTYEYICHYCEQERKDLPRTLWALVSDTEKLLRAIIDTQETLAREEVHA